MTDYERKLAEMTPEQREETKKAIGEMMGMPPMTPEQKKFLREIRKKEAQQKKKK